MSRKEQCRRGRRPGFPLISGHEFNQTDNLLYSGRRDCGGTLAPATTRAAETTTNDWKAGLISP